MTDKIVEIEIGIDGSDVVKTSMTGLTADSLGWHVKVNASAGQKAVFKVKGRDTANHALITHVLSVDGDGNTIETWNGSSGTHHVSSPYASGTELTLEVHNTPSAGPVPTGGGYFRVLDEGAGGPP